MESSSESVSSDASEQDEFSTQHTDSGATNSPESDYMSNSTPFSSSDMSLPSLTSSSDMESVSTLLDMGNTSNLDRQAEPLYSGAEISTLMTYLLLFQYAIRHGLSTKAFSELIQLVRVLLPKEAKLPTTVHKLKNFLSDLFPDMQADINAYCSFCHRLLPSPLAMCSLCPESRTERFVTIPLQPQFKRMLEGKQSTLIRMKVSNIYLLFSIPSSSYQTQLCGNYFNRDFSERVILEHSGIFMMVKNTRNMSNSCHSQLTFH